MPAARPASSAPKGYTHWLGTDAQGRDLLSAILYGLGVSLQSRRSLAGAVAFTLGASLGAHRGLSQGGRTEAFDHAASSICSFPSPRSCSLSCWSALLGQGKCFSSISALVTAQYAYFARTAHGAATTERAKDYVAAALVHAAIRCSTDRVPPHPAQLPAAFDRGRDGAESPTRSRWKQRCPSSASACR